MNVNPYNTKAYENNHNWTLGENKPNQTQFKPKTNPIFKIPKMNVSTYYTMVYNKKTAFRRIQNKPKSKPKQTQLVFCPPFPDKAVFSFDLLARPVILNPNIRQLHRPMRSEQIGPFKARKETYHVY